MCALVPSISGVAFHLIWFFRCEDVCFPFCNAPFFHMKEVERVLRGTEGALRCFDFLYINKWIKRIFMLEVPFSHSQSKLCRMRILRLVSRSLVLSRNLSTGTPWTWNSSFCFLPPAHFCVCVYTCTLLLLTFSTPWCSPLFLFLLYGVPLPVFV
jgi:hypothetical protein